MRVLLIEDDDRIAVELERVLRKCSFSVRRESDGAAGYRAGLEGFAAVILDLGLPSLDGLTVLRRWRKHGVRTPVLALTARGSWMERVEGLDAGADDYLPKPFQMPELLARVRALVRRGSQEHQAEVGSKDVAIDPRQMCVVYHGRSISLTPQEFKAVGHLVANRGRVVPARELIEHVHGNGSAVTNNAIEALIGRARRKLGPDLIETRRGFGYIVP